MKSASAAKTAPRAAALATGRGKATTEPRKVIPLKPVQVAKPAPIILKRAGPALQTFGKPIVTAATPHHGKARHSEDVTSRTPSAAPGAEVASKLAALSGALGPVIAGRSTLRGADMLKTGAPGDVTLSVPQDFADGLKDQAQRTGLTDAAASAAITAKLSGDGYAVSPADVQSRPLMSGKPTDFRWTVTKMDAARGPLQAEVGADLLGGGRQHLDFGAIAAKPSSGFKLSAQAIGAGLLLLVVILAGALMSGGRRSREPDARTPDVRT